MLSYTAHVDFAADAIVTTRDFCGDEMQTVRDYCADTGIDFTEKFFRQARYRANAWWNRDQRSAGVPEKYLF